MAAGSSQRMAGVEANFRRVNDQRIIVKTLVFERVGNDQRSIVEDGMSAKGNVASGRIELQPALRLEPLAVGVDQRNVGDGNVVDAGRQSHDSIEALFGRRVQELQGRVRPPDDRDSSTGTGAEIIADLVRVNTPSVSNR